MRIGFVTDEISPKVEEAIRTGVSWGVQDYELRMIGNCRVPHITEREVAEIKALQANLGITFTAISPGTFKCPVEDDQQIAYELDRTLPKTFELARAFGVEKVLTFGFFKASHEPKANEMRVVDIFGGIAELASQNGLIVAVENEPDFWCDTGKNTAHLLKQVNSPALRANWDPANAVGLDEKPFPQGYRSIKNWIANVHIKDTTNKTNLECVPVGTGQVDWPGQLKALVADRVVDHITIETHCEPLLENSKKNLETVRDLLLRFNDPDLFKEASF